MNLKAVHHVTLSTPTFHALSLVARVDRVSPDWIAEQVVAAYLENRLGAIHEASHEQRTDGGGRVIDLAAWRDSRHDP
jgi:hypothetical protein